MLAGSFTPKSWMAPAKAPGHPDLPAQAHQRAARRGGGPLGGGGRAGRRTPKAGGTGALPSRSGSLSPPGPFPQRRSPPRWRPAAAFGPWWSRPPYCPQEGDAEVQQPKGGGDALVEQIPPARMKSTSRGERPAFPNAKVTASFWRPGLGLFPAAPPGGWCPQRSGRNRRPGDPRPPACPPPPRGRGSVGAVKLQGAAGPAASLGNLPATATQTAPAHTPPTP